MLSFLNFYAKFQSKLEQEVRKSLTGRTIMFSKYFSISTAYSCIAFTVTHARPFLVHTCFLKTNEQHNEVTE